MSELNVLFLFSDEHRKDALGCYGHPFVKTPNLDRIAAEGTRFTKAYTPSPICVPARASLATGRYVHKTRCWSNAQAYQGSPESWGHVLQENERSVESIGKLHYRGATFDNGFDKELLPLYIRDGKGWIKGLLRNHESVLDCSSYASEIGAGSSSYTDYDEGVTESACQWIKESSKKAADKPWTLFVSWLRPHYPLTCPIEFFDLYPLSGIDEARFRSRGELPDHPVLKTIMKNFDYDRHFTDETRQIARASYFGLCSFLDYQVGQVLQSLKDSGQYENTLIVYSSDHGDHNGDRGMWTKMTMYDESSSIPLIISGPGIPESHSVDTPASLVDIYPTILNAAGLEDRAAAHDGIALQKLAVSDDYDRSILSEYHDGGSPTGLFMLRTSRWKYNVYPGFSPELFDMDNDPEELKNLAGQSRYSDVEANCRSEMYKLVNPEVENDKAFSDQSALIEKLGGEDVILNSDEFDFTPISQSE